MMQWCSRWGGLSRTTRRTGSPPKRACATPTSGSDRVGKSATLLRPHPERPHRGIDLRRDGAGAGHDLARHPGGEFRPGRDGDVHHLPGALQPGAWCALLAGLHHCSAFRVPAGGGGGARAGPPGRERAPAERRHPDAGRAPHARGAAPAAVSTDRPGAADARGRLQRRGCATARGSRRPHAYPGLGARVGGGGAGRTAHRTLAAAVSHIHGPGAGLRFHRGDPGRPRQPARCRRRWPGDGIRPELRRRLSRLRPGDGGRAGHPDRRAHGPTQRAARLARAAGGVAMRALTAGWRSLLTPTLSRDLGLALGGFILLLLLSSQIGAYDDYNLAAVAIFAIATAGLNLLTGVNGQLSLGHGALMAVGAYSTSLLLRGHDLPLILVLLASLAAASLVGAVFGVAAARLRGPYLAGATLALAVGLPQIATRYSHVFGGEEGLTVPPPTAPDWLGADFPPERWLAWIAIAAALVTMVLLGNLLQSSVGRTFKAVRDHEAAAALAGINVARTQVVAFVISSACAGLAGSLFAYWAGLTAPAGFGVALSLQLVSAIVIGGLGSLSGAVWGSIVLVYVPALTSGMASSLKLPSAVGNNLPLLIYGAVLVVAMLVVPDGIDGGLRRLFALARARLAGATTNHKGVVDWDDPAGS